MFEPGGGRCFYHRVLPRLEKSDVENVFDSKLTRANYFYYLKVLVILGKGSCNFLRQNSGLT